MKEEIIKQIKKILSLDTVELETPENSLFGDYSTNIAMIGAKKEGKNPRDLAQEYLEKLNSSDDLPKIIEKIDIAGPGFINFWLKKDILVIVLKHIDSDAEEFGTSKSLDKKKVILEFTDPNPFKEFHIGHLYTNTVGESLSRIFEANGAEVKRANYQGDVGLHVAKSVWGLMYKMKEDKLSAEDLEERDLADRAKYLGESYALGSRAYEEDASTKEEINNLNKKIFENDVEVDALYQKGRSWSLDYFETIYKRLGTKFDFYYFESKVGKLGEKIVKENLQKGIFENSKGAVIFPGSKYGLHDRVFINSLGLPTYEAKELGLAPTKYEDFKYDESIIITANEINEYFKVLIKAMSLIYPDLGDKTTHIGHGVVKLPEGKMSSRTGKIVSGEGLIDQVKEAAAKINNDVAEEVAIAAIKYSFLKVGVGKDIVFDIEKSLSLEGDSGPYIQYTFARTQSVLEKAKDSISKEIKSEDLNDEELLVLRTLSRYPEVIEVAAKTYSPNIICNYLYDLAQSYNSFYNKHKIIESDNEELRLMLTKGVGQVIQNGLKLLGIKAPNRM